MTNDAKRRYAAAAFVTLLALSVVWPSPVVAMNELWVHAHIDVDSLSSLGREAPSWDAVFWCLAGLLLLVILQSADPAADAREPLRQLRVARKPTHLSRRIGLACTVGVLATAWAWLVGDVVIVRWVERIHEPWTRDVIRLLNRLGGGMNPALIVLFFLISGVCYRERRWTLYGVAMALAALTAGITVQVIKHVVGRARPELWLGPSHYVPGASTSFPSGHTVGAFALAGVLLFACRTMPLRCIAIVLAAGVGGARILAFRHWPSDVIASATLGLIAAAVAVTMLTDHEPGVERHQEKRGL